LATERALFDLSRVFEAICEGKFLMVFLSKNELELDICFIIFVGLIILVKMPIK
jgi:hypothetical protein